MAAYYAVNPQQRWKIRVELLHITPVIWREFSLPAGSLFAELHHAIQCAMGWDDCHLHRFCDPSIEEPTRIITDPENFEGPGHPWGWEDEWCLSIADYIADGGPRTLPYQYDFGDDWIHAVTFLESYHSDSEPDGPVMISGARACPPEDCGGIPGYEHLLADPESMKDWISNYDPEAFDPKSVSFEQRPEDDPDDW